MYDPPICPRFIFISWEVTDLGFIFLILSITSTLWLPLRLASKRPPSGLFCLILPIRSTYVCHHVYQQTDRFWNLFERGSWLIASLKVIGKLFLASISTVASIFFIYYLYLVCVKIFLHLFILLAYRDITALLWIY